MNVETYLNSHYDAIKSLDLTIIRQAADKIKFELGLGKKVLTAGNGGSASDAQHFVAELVGRFHNERKPYPAICLNENTSTITAIANDYGYNHVFGRQVTALLQSGDVLFLLSTSGESKSIIEAAKVARERFGHSANIISISGKVFNNELVQLSTIPIYINSYNTAIIQELSIIIIHMICGIIDEELS
jgi:D-sedoheptulose 7-phosphate isomerase